MPLVKKVEYIHEPTDLQCGQAVLAMLSGVSVNEIIDLLNNERETDLKQMFNSLDYYGIKYNRTRLLANVKEDLPKIALLSLETPRCWHWSLYFNGTFYDPEHGVMDDFPESKRKFYWEIKK